MEQSQPLKLSIQQRRAYGTYKCLANVLWVPRIIGRLARSLIRRQVPTGLLEQNGLYASQRPLANPLIWFHANTSGECVLCLPLIHRVVVEYNEKVLILVSVRSKDTLHLLKSSLPERVILVHAPVDACIPVSRFLSYWRPCIGVMLTGSLATNLILQAHQAKIPLALLDASIPKHTFHFWHRSHPRRALFSSLASAFSLIIPHSDIEVGRFRLMGATLAQMPGWCNDLAYACSLSSPVNTLYRPSERKVHDLQALLKGRDAWLACNLTAGEEADLRSTHRDLHQEFPRLLTVYVPQDGTRGAAIAETFRLSGVQAACLSSPPESLDGYALLVVDAPWALQLFMNVCELVFIGSVALSGDQNYALLAQAAISSCAVVAAGSVPSHQQLAQELNNAAMNAAEDTANAVRTAGVDLDAHTPWRETASVPGEEAQAPRPGNPAERSSGNTLASSGDSSEGSDEDDSDVDDAIPRSPSHSTVVTSGVDSSPEPSRNGEMEGRPSAPPPLSPAVPSPRSPAAAQRAERPAALAVASPVSACSTPRSIRSHPASPLAGPNSPDPTATRPLRRPGHPDLWVDPNAEAVDYVEEELHTVRGPPPPSPRTTALALTGSGGCLGEAEFAELDTCVGKEEERESPMCGALGEASSGGRMLMHALLRSPAQPQTPSQAGNSLTGYSSPSPPAVGLPLTRSPDPLRRLRPTAPATLSSPPTSWNNFGTNLCSEPGTPLSVGTPSSLHMSILHPPAFSTSHPTPQPGPSGSPRFGLRTVSSLHGSLPRSCLHRSQSSVDTAPGPLSGLISPSTEASSALSLPQRQALHLTESCCSVSSGDPTAAEHVPRECAPPRAHVRMQEVPLMVMDDNVRRLTDCTDSAGGVAQTLSMTPAATCSSAKEAYESTEGVALSSRSMIGSERPQTASSCTTDSVPRPMSPVATPSTLNRIRMPVSKPPQTAAAPPPATVGATEPPAAAPGVSLADVGPGSGRFQMWRRTSDGFTEAPGSRDGAESAMDLWAGASPYMRVHDATAVNDSFPLNASSLGEAEAHTVSNDGALPRWSVDPTSIVPDRSRRITVRHALLRYQNKYLLSAIHMPPHPEGPAVWLLSQSHSLADVVASLLREPVSRQSRGYIAVQAAARLSNSLVSTIWDVLDGSVLEPALLAFEGAQPGCTSGLSSES